jgi:hypothetical protein
MSHRESYLAPYPRAFTSDTSEIADPNLHFFDFKTHEAIWD